MNSSKNTSVSFKNDIPAGIVVFLVALPLCLGIALLSGAPLTAGIISGIIGGIVVASISGSALGVSGPAAGLAIIVLSAIEEFDSFQIFLVAVVIAGAIQLFFGLIKAGFIAYYFPSSVIHGMLSGIGIIIFLQQIPHAMGYDKVPEGEMEFFQSDNENIFSELFNMVDYINFGAIIIALVSLVILILWNSKWIKSNPILSLVPGPLLAVISGVVLGLLFDGTDLQISKEHFVDIPVYEKTTDFFHHLTFPDFSFFSKQPDLINDVIITAVFIALIASIETLLSVEAIDKLDSKKRVTPTNRELVAQGIGNMVSGFLGGLPITQVIVRSSANEQAGANSKLSAIFHGILLLLSVLFLPKFINLVPYASLAAILLVIGFNLAKPKLFIKAYQEGREQFIPFVVTIVAILFSDLLKGIIVGFIVALFIILKKTNKINLKISFKIQRYIDGVDEVIKIKLVSDITFLNKASITRLLDEIPEGTIVYFDVTNANYIHPDVQEVIEDFEINAQTKDIKINFINNKNQDLIEKQNFNFN